jgi:hypothetical protein
MPKCMSTLVFSGTEVRQCKCPSGKNTRFLDTSDYILQVILTECKDAGFHQTRQFENSVCLKRYGQQLLAACVKVEFDADIANCLLALRLLQCNRDHGRKGATRCIGTIDIACLSDWVLSGPTNRLSADVADSEHSAIGRFTQVTSQPVVYSWQSERLQVADLSIADCRVVGGHSATRASVMWKTGPVESASMLNRLQKLEEHVYKTSFLTCKKGFRFPLAPSNMVVIPNLYQFTVPEIDCIPLADVEQHIASYNNPSIPPSCIENMLMFTRHIAADTGEGELANQWGSEWLAAAIWGNNGFYGSDKTFMGKDSEQFQTISSVIQAIISAGAEDSVAVGDCEDKANSIIAFARRLSGMKACVSNQMEFLPVVCAVNSAKVEPGVKAIDKMTDIRQRAADAKWSETSGCHTMSVAMHASTLDEMLDRSCSVFMSVKQHERCCFVNELSQRALRNLMAELPAATSGVCKALYVSTLAGLLQQRRVSASQANQIADDAFYRLDRVSKADTITLNEMEFCTQMYRHEAHARQPCKDNARIANKLLEGTALLEVSGTANRTSSACYTAASILCHQTGSEFATIESIQEVPDWYRLAVVVVVRGSQYLCQSVSTGVIGVCMQKMIEEPEDILLRPMQRVLSTEEKRLCRRRLTSILPQVPLQNCNTPQQPLPETAKAGQWVLLKGIETPEMRAMPGFHQVNLCVGVNLNTLLL